MITGELRDQVDKLHTEFWTGEITNLLMVIEQIPLLMFAHLLDNRETREEKKAHRTGKAISTPLQTRSNFNLSTMKRINIIGSIYSGYDAIKYQR
ncbi:MAG: hypothetical protein JW932_03800 [Deltaproteobacteria bacterium]|nr:hypothetical protein [Deltaproteobacteria bacterium]